MRAIPGPTEAWADIIGSLAWPGVVVFLVLRFRVYLRTFLNTVADRLQTDHVKLGPFELTPNSDVIALYPEDANESTVDYSADDILAIEALFEFVAEPDNFDRLSMWVNDNVDGSLAISEFLTLPRYASQRAKAYTALVRGEK